LDQVEVRLAGHLLRLGGRHDAQLLPVGPDQPDRADPDLLVHARAAVLLLLSVGRTRGNTSISFLWGQGDSRPGTPIWTRGRPGRFICFHHNLTRGLTPGKPFLRTGAELLPRPPPEDTRTAARPLRCILRWNEKERDMLEPGLPPEPQPPL